MPGDDVSIELVRVAVRQWLERHVEQVGPAGGITVACSGGADSLALALGAFRTVDGSRLGAVTVDHGLQPGSVERANATAAQLREIGYRSVRIDTVTIDSTAVGRQGGLEAAARTARYATIRREGQGAVLLGHTADDQAETVLLGLGRGSGPRSIAGMTSWRRPWGRPLLGLRRSDTEAACREAGLEYWSDPHNLDPAFTRVRLRREVLPLLDEVLGGGVPNALARTAGLLAEDLEALDFLAARVLADVWQTGGALDLAALSGHPVALRRRALRAWADAMGARALTADHLMRLDALAVGAAGSGAVRLPGALDAVRTGGVLRAVPAG